MSDNNYVHPSNQYDGLDSDDDDVSIDTTSSNDRIAGNNRLRPMVLSWNNRQGIQINGDVEQPAFIFLLPSIERARTAIEGFFDGLSSWWRRQLKQINEAQVVIVFETATVMSVLGLTSKDDILNQSAWAICSNVPALKICPSKRRSSGALNSVETVFGGDCARNLSNVTWNSGPILHYKDVYTLIKYNSSGIGGPQYQTPQMSDINTNGNELVLMGSRGLVTRIQAVGHWIENTNVLLVYDALNGGTSLISILMNQGERFAFFATVGRNVRDSFTLPQVRASMPGGLRVGGANDLWLVKGLMRDQCIDDFTVVADADARIAAINNHYQELLQDNAPDICRYGKNCIVSENGVNIAKFSSVNKAVGGSKCANYADYGVGFCCIVPGQSRRPRYSLALLREAIDPRGLQSAKYPGRYLRLCLVGEFNSSNTPNPWGDDDN